MNKWYFLTIFIFVVIASFGQKKREIHVDAPKVVMTGESFQVKYILTNPSSPNPRFYPPVGVDGLTSYGMSSYTSRQSSVTIINGRLRTTTTQTITWILTFVAEKPGNYTIPPAKVQDGNSSLNFSPITITVEGQVNNNLPKSNKQIANQNSESDVILPSKNNKFFVRLIADKTNVYQGEAIYINARLYSMYRLSIDEMEPSQLKGFWVQDLKMPSRIQADHVLINGRDYLVATIDKKVIFPQQTGKLKIAPYKVTCSFYDDWGFPYGQKEIVSNSLLINVKPLPQQGKPSSFSGAVGQFKIDMKIEKTKLNIDEPLTIKLIISGTGNFSLFDIPEPKIPNSFEVLEPKTIPQYKASTEGLTGRITKQFIYIPRSGGNFHIPSIEFSFFDPKSKKYVVLHTQPLDIIVSGSVDSLANNGNVVYKSDVTQIGNDINYIFTQPFKLTRKGSGFVSSNIFYLAYLIALIVFVVIVYLRRRYIKEMSDIRKYRSRKARKESKKRLRVAYKYMKQNKEKEFYTEISKALWQYVGDKLGIDGADLTRDKVREEFLKRKVSEEVIDEFMKIINDSDAQRFAQLNSSNSMDIIYKRAKKIIEDLQSII